ncbi:hypothetical protein [Sphingobacterium sp.]
MYRAKVWLYAGLSKEKKLYVSGIGEIPKVCYEFWDGLFTGDRFPDLN